MQKNLFDQIKAEKQDIPKMDKALKEVKGHKFNFYQKVSIITMLACFVIGIILGNLFPSCISGGLYSATCTNTEFNVSLTLLFWFVTFLICMMMYAVGHIISLLEKISQNLK
jgi:ACR3 family arsenite efflux pump ArsB